MYTDLLSKYKKIKNFKSQDTKYSILDLTRHWNSYDPNWSQQDSCQVTTFQESSKYSGDSAIHRMAAQ